MQEYIWCLVSLPGAVKNRTIDWNGSFGGAEYSVLFIVWFGCRIGFDTAPRCAYADAV